MLTLFCLLRLWCSRRSGSRVGGAAGGVVVSPMGNRGRQVVEKIKRYWWLAACLWALLAFVSWHFESTCGVFFSSACLSEYWDGIRWIALLKWVFPYQTLIGGFAALLAGFIVLKSTRETIEASKHQKLIELELMYDQQVAHSAKILQLVALEFYILCGKFMSRFTRADGFSTSWLDNFGQDVVEHDPELWEIARKSETLINHLMAAEIDASHRGSIMDQCALLAYAAYEVFQQAANEDLEEDSPHRVAHFDPTEVNAFMEDRGLVRSQLLDLQRYFNWMKSRST